MRKIFDQEVFMSNCPTPEPTIRSMIVSFYRRVFDEKTSANLADSLIGYSINQAFVDVIVIDTTSLDDDHAAKFDQDWIVQFADGSFEEFETEDEACAYQRGWRHAHGRDGITGET